MTDTCPGADLVIAGIIAGVRRATRPGAVERRRAKTDRHLAMRDAYLNALSVAPRDMRDRVARLAAASEARAAAWSAIMEGEQQLAAELHRQALVTMRSACATGRLR